MFHALVFYPCLFLFMYVCMHVYLRCVCLCRLIVEAAVHRSAVAIMPLAGENPHVGSPEGSVTQCIAHGVNGAVDITQVIEEVPELLRDALATGGERLEKNEDVVWGPG